MSRKTIRVDIPIDKPDETIKLCEDINEKHIALGVNSPLTSFFDMAAFIAKALDAKQKRKDARIADGKSQSSYNQSATLCGIAKGQNKQTKGTLYVLVCSIRDFLQLKFRDNPEELSNWGFEVVITQSGGRRYVAITVPVDTPENLLSLCNSIIAKHVLDGPGSVLTDSEVDMTDFAAIVSDAASFLDTSQEQFGIRQSNNNQADNIIGYAEGQTSETPGTLYYDITGIRDRLLNKHAGTEEMLSEYGFKVVIGTSSLPDDEDTPPPPPTPG